MFSRNYLMAHYPSDVLFALLIGVFSGFVAAIITQLIFRFLENHSGEGKFYDFLLYTGFEDLSEVKALAGSVKSGIGTSASRGGSHRQAVSDEMPSTRSTGARHAASSSDAGRTRRSSSSGAYQGKH